MLAILVALGAAPMSQAQEFPQVREVRAHRANYSARSSRRIRRIVLHTSEGSEASCISWFRNPRSRVSAHYLVGFQGRITRLVPDMSVAYHARQYNADSIGIENEGWADRDRWTTAQYRSLAAVVRGLCDRYSIPKERQFIIGHSQVPGSGKVDPGRYFDWSRFMALVREGPSGSSGTPPATGLATVVHSVATGGATASSSASLVEVTTEGLVAHTAPDGQSLGRLGRGTRFVTTGRSPGWTRITWRGRSAWVSAAGVRNVQSGEVEIVTASALNVRAGPSTSSTLLGQVARDQAYHRLEQSGPWALIQFDHRRAWVHTNYTRSASLP